MIENDRNEGNHGNHELAKAIDTEHSSKDNLLLKQRCYLWLTQFGQMYNDILLNVQRLDNLDQRDKTVDNACTTISTFLNSCRETSHVATAGSGDWKEDEENHKSNENT